ncbi:MAG: class I SAM-dependent methyltransferase [Bacteroidota bacterium]|nr:class I SAM-dependent methyltransferase [Bacteroidota bacterium]
MKQKKLFHPRVFNETEWAEGYYKRNKKSIEKVGKRFAKLLKTIGFTSGSILDVGCGFVTVPIEIAKAFPDTKITGIDLSEPLLKIGHKLINDEGLGDRIILLKGDAQDLKFEKDSFDVVINTFLLHIVENPILMLNEIERVAKPDAIILITDLRRGFLAYLVPKFRTAYTAEEANIIIKKSKIRKGGSSKGLFWWDYICDK